MSTAASPIRDPFSSAQPHLFLAYEDVSLGCRALEACTQLISSASPNTGLTRNIWSFDSLRAHGGEPAVTENLAVTDLMVVAAHGDHDLPDHVKRVLNDWLETHPHEDLALVGMLDRVAKSRAEHSPALNSLSALASHEGVQLFIKTMRAVESADDRAEGWGIND